MSENINSFNLYKFIINELPEKFNKNGSYMTEIYNDDDIKIRLEKEAEKYLKENDVLDMNKFSEVALKNIYEDTFTNEYNVYGLQDMINNFRNKVGVDICNNCLYKSGIINESELNNKDYIIEIENIGKLMDLGFGVDIDIEKMKDLYKDEIISLQFTKKSKWNIEKDDEELER